MYTEGTAYGANVQGDKTICLRTVLIVWESFNKLRKTKQQQQNTKISTGMFDFYLYFICNKSKA